MYITKVTTKDARFKLYDGAGSDAVHTADVYSYPVCELHGDLGQVGIGIALTLGGGNELICTLIEQLSQPLIGKDIEEVMANFGTISKSLADHPQYRWLGPHKGMVHLALASLANACFDLWAKSRGVPLWKLLLDLNPEQVIDLLDLSYLEDVLTKNDCLKLLRDAQNSRTEREVILKNGYPGYDTSIGWFNYSDGKIKDNIRKAIDAGFDAMKLKVGAKDSEQDLRRAYMVREVAGDAATIMLDCNQQWTLPQALDICPKFADMNPYWIEEPTHPDDVNGHRELAKAIQPIKIACGEHVPNRVLFKNYMQAAGAMHFVQADCVRLAGVTEFITVSLLAKKFDLPVVPHVGDMGQIHQHLVLFNHIAIGHEALLLEHIPHLRQHFLHPAQVEAGVYRTPQEPGLSCDFKT